MVSAMIWARGLLMGNDVDVVSEVDEMVGSTVVDKGGDGVICFLADLVTRPLWQGAEILMTSFSV